MSNHKVDISEVDKYSNDFKEASEEIRSNLDKVKEHIDSINNMESFSGKAAKEAKGYFNEMHLTILESFRGLFDDLDENMKQHLQTFATEVDSSDSTVIESNYLQDVKEDINEIYEDLEKQDEIFHDTIEDVADITSATSPDFSEVNEWKRKSVEKIKELDEDLVSFTSTDDETDVKEIMNQIETVMNNAKTSEGKARFADFKGASDNSELKKLMEYNESKNEETMEKAKDAKENAVKQLDETSSKDVVNKAYQEFKDGDISYEQYIAILDSVKNTSDDLDEKTIKENADEEFIQYLTDRGLLDDYLAEHKTVDEQEKIKNLDKETKSYLDRIEEAYENGELTKKDYEEVRSEAINEGAENTEKLIDKLLNNDQHNNSNEGLIRILNGGTAVAKKILESYIEDKGVEFITSTINEALAKNTFHFVNLGGVAQTVGGGEALLSKPPSVTSEMVRTGARHGVPIVGSIIDYSMQVAGGEDPTDALIKTGGHTGAALIGASVGTAIGGPLGTVVGAGIGMGGSWLFDQVYDNKDKIIEGAKNFVGDAVSGITDGLGSIFS